MSSLLFRRASLALVFFQLMAVAAFGQTIAGTVRDDTGAVMPGVTVEASSDALIEKVRTVVTDNTGQYKVVNLSPGVYIVTFTLPGFSTVRREGIQLSTDFTANVNADLKVGAVEETITVSGASPLVDIQSASRQTVLTREVLDTLPTARSIQAAGVLIPGVTMSATVGGGRDVGGSTKLQQPGLTFHGNGQTIQRWDGFWLSNVQGTGTGGATSFYVNDAGAQELVYSTGAETMDMATLWPLRQHDSEGRRQQVLGPSLRRLHAQAVARLQPDRQPEGARADQRGTGEPHLGFQHRSRRSDRAQQDVVLRGLSLRGARSHGRGQLLRQESVALSL